MMKATAMAPANIAFIKYWGKKDVKLRIPSNSSISMNLSACTTTTTVEFSDDFEKDIVSEGFDSTRIIEHINRFRKRAKTKVKVTTKNSFPTAAGIASSASGFAALTLAASAALGLKLSERKLSEIARLGSGSACRSIPDGFVKWEKESASSMYPETHWDLRDIIVIVEEKMKETLSTAGHDLVSTSPYFTKRLEALPERISRVQQGLKTRNFRLLGEAIEEDCLEMHHVMQTQNPPLFYWTKETSRVIDTVKKSGLPAYFTVDAGPNVHIICEQKTEKNIIDVLKNYQIIVNKPAKGAHLI